MKLKLHKPIKLNSVGASHIIIPLVAILVIGGIGLLMLKLSHADSLKPTTNTASTTPTTSKLTSNVAILGAAQAQSGTTTALSSVPYSFVGSQTVNYLGTGQSLNYTQAIKGSVTSCFEVYVTQPKSGTATATVEFATNDNYVTVNLSSTTTNNLQEVCVPPSNKVNPGFAVKNLTSAQQNVSVEVYQDILKW